MDCDRNARKDHEGITHVFVQARTRLKYAVILCYVAIDTKHVGNDGKLRGDDLGVPHPPHTLFLHT